MSKGISQRSTARGIDKEDVILKMRDASVTFDMERGESKVVDSVDLDIRRGETLGLVGESGSGKSMAASSLVDAVVEPGILSGEVTYYPEDGDPVDVLSLTEPELKNLRWKEIAFLVQAVQSAFNPTMTIRDHFIETLDTHDADREEGMERAHELLEEVYLEPEVVLDSVPHELSGGMKQRALIALSLILQPDVLILDEPTSALDLLMQRTIVSLLANLKEKYGLTMVFISHDLATVADLADRIAVMYAFQVAEIGPTEVMTHDPSHPYTRALIKSVPDVLTPVDQMKAIEGESPDPVNVPNGCSYHPRCPLADEQCRKTDPEFRRTEKEGNAVRCHHWEDAADIIPFEAVADSGEDQP